MPAQWTGTIIGKMHLYSITGLALAKALSWHPKYLSAVMHGHRSPKGAEEKINAALDALIAEQEATK